MSILYNKYKKEIKDVISYDNIYSNRELIGLNRYILYKDNNEITLYDYNYLLSKKFRYFKSEAILNCKVFFFIINVHDSRGLENMKSIIDEIWNIKKTNSKEISFHGILIKQSENFLLNLTQERQIISVKENYSLTSFIEVELENIKIDEIINAIVNEKEDNV